MVPTKFLLVLALWLPLSTGDVTPSTTTKCEYPCQQPSSPPSGYLPYGAPPPPPSPPPPSGYSIYEAPPPPQEKGQSKCPPTAGVECCTPSAPHTFPPPNPYTPVPYDEGQSASMLLPVLVPLIMLFSSFTFLF